MNEKCRETHSMRKIGDLVLCAVVACLVGAFSAASDDNEGLWPSSSHRPCCSSHCRTTRSAALSHVHASRHTVRKLPSTRMRGSATPIAQRHAHVRRLLTHPSDLVARFQCSSLTRLTEILWTCSAQGLLSQTPAFHSALAKSSRVAL